MSLSRTAHNSASFLLRLQALFVLPVFVSVLTGKPGIWAAWGIALIPVAVRATTERRIAGRTPFDLLIALSLAGVAIGFSMSPDKTLAVAFIHSYLACVVLYYGLADNYRAPQAYWYTLAGAIFGILAFLALWTFQGTGVRHLGYNNWLFSLAAHLRWPLALGAHLNTLGVAYAVLLPIPFAVTLFRQKAWIRWVCAVISALMILVLVFSASPNSWVAASVGLLIVLAACDYRAALGLAVVLMLAAAAVWTAQPAWLVALSPGFATIDGRFEIWRTVIRELRTSPFLGMGITDWSTKQFPGYSAMGTPHNAYIELYWDTGVFSLAVLAAGIVAGFKQVRMAWRSPRNSRLRGASVGIAASLAVFGVMGLVEVDTNAVAHVGGRALYFAVPLVWLLMALIVVVNRRRAEAGTQDSTTV